MQLKVFVRALRVEAEIGCYPHEFGRLQPLIVDIELDLESGGVERLRDTVDYDRLVRSAKAIAAGGHIDLVETYAARLAEACLAEPHVARVRVRVEKPEAVPDAAAAGVEVSVARG
jgi:dihydroneopterin aldolase